MREILFRGKTEPVFSHWDDEQMKEIFTPGAWIYGGIGITEYCTEIMTDGFMCHINKGGRRWMDEEIEAIRVVPETVGRYINAFDANGKEICEGDILRDTDGCGIYEFMCFLVEEGEGEYILRINEKEILDEYFDWDEFEVIGNIHDNPELLEEDKND